ncbi:hypothetical protein [Allofournierella massiliensis]|uniref:Uncharacterized protein n=1 Tax=Allofournierella massiliensis TaxID=1650663 RepID=A0ABT7UN10_9FIRM|nr:hypothetical protein [Fournierella massiliensis]MDM8200277.1 hypothetical protein [Fournierella massiliensis]
MATWLNDYRAYKEALSQEFESGDIKINKVLQYQELLYRIDVLETCQMLCKTAPITMDMKSLVMHYQLVDAYIQNLSKERRIGLPADDKLKASRETSAAALESTVADCRKRFSSFRAENEQLYKRSISTLLNTVLPVWLQLRNTYTPITK